MKEKNTQKTPKKTKSSPQKAGEKKPAPKSRRTKKQKKSSFNQFINNLFISIILLGLIALIFIGVQKYFFATTTVIQEQKNQAVIQKSLNELAKQAPKSQGNQTQDNLNENDKIETWLKRIDSALSASIKSSNITQSEIKQLTPTKIKIFNLNYLCQNIELNLNIESADFIMSLKNNLQLFADDASLKQVNENHWQISVYNIVTHNLYIKRNYSFNEFEEGEETPETITLTLDELMASLNKGKSGRLAIVIDDLGNSVNDMQALTDLNYPVSVAIWPHGMQKNESAKLAKQKGLDILVHVPMEPVRLSEFKPGPNALYSGMSLEKIHAITETQLNSVPYAIGLNNHMGSRFTQWKEGVRTVVNVAKNKNFFVLDSVTHQNSDLFKEAKNQGVKAYQRQVFLDNQESVNYVLKQLALAEKVALHQGEAIAIGHPHASTLEALKIWQSQKNPDIEYILVHEIKE
ncbi:divergent polysaccharide deacetylase family protein [Desulfovibrio litoralis]|uniref:Divergent polysaccharide deacetylase n=1 Tax=Desulfovibrio litoralis DSM 11393 TaxID=1121455 RepID=A0A1M7THN9_9BACT|nr:divergent polysaccharide deacetylase family protein [Desulfovibrio litoralis]SHN70191.1 hypothetical protein SAMN02745728_02010 [Desulfovibrio litoralis DSM 11393]